MSAYHGTDPESEEDVKNLIFILIVPALLFSCSETIHVPAEEEWTAVKWNFLGLGGRRVEALRVNGNLLYAITDDGVYRKVINSTDSVWTPLGLQGKHGQALLVISADTILAGVRCSGLDDDTTSLFRTVDGGAGWHPFQNGLSSPYHIPVRDLECVPHQSATLFTVGPVPVAKTVDGGLSWRTVLEGTSCGIKFLRIDPSSPNIVWVGGENVIFSPCLLKSTDSGENWQQLSPWHGGDNSCHSIAIHPLNPDLAYVPMEGAVIKTTNGGNDWSVVFDEKHSYLYAIAIDPDNPSSIYVAGAAMNPQPLILYRSTDAGSSWSSIDEKNPELTSGVMDLLLASSGNSVRLYFATIGNGVYQCTIPRLIR
jgi:photosystem II stability/assembly factor-like uncharacterized protein